MNAKERRELLCGIADKVYAYRASHGMQSLKRINISTALYKLIAGCDYDENVRNKGVRLFSIEVSVYESDKPEYSFTSEVFEINTGKKEES